MPTSKRAALRKSSPGAIYMLNTRSRPSRQRVTDATQGADRLCAELPTQVVDVHLDRVALDLVSPAIHPFLELRLRQRRTRPLEERGEERELARRQVHRSRRLGYRVPAQVELEIAVAQNVRFARDVAAQECPHPRAQLLEAERLGQV